GSAPQGGQQHKLQQVAGSHGSTIVPRKGWRRRAERDSALMKMATNARPSSASSYKNSSK
ncbi:MAG: hypothetical protein ACRCVM_05580, partial [Giesbergeria sp.]